MTESTQTASTTAEPTPTAADAARNATARIREIFGRFRLPGFDFEAYIEARQADIDAISKATSVAFAGAETITQKQAELLKATLEEISSAIKSRKSHEPGDTPSAAAAASAASEAIGKQTDLIRSTLSRTLDGMKEMAEAAQKSQTEIYEIALDRARANAEQLRHLFVRGDHT